jgi:hypothetical protein
MLDGEVVELDGGTLVLDGEECPSVVLRLAPWRARSVARVLREWTSVSRIFHHSPRSHLDELHLSWTLELVAAASVTAIRRVCDPLADPASSQIGDAWLLWQFWASVRRTSPRFSALP